jgi:2,4-dienoyl-CoA reductase-like NADH-dependent reductase (Old Yellow Enzyme family)
MLFESLRFRNGVVARNRAWLAPMTNQQSHADGSLSDEELAWLEMRARGGFGVVETCAAHVARDGQGWPGALGVDDDRLLPGLRRLAAMFSGAGALGVVQLFHGGLRSPRALTGSAPWSATDYQAAGAERARAATEEDLARVVDQFRAAAVRSSIAGLAGVELHGAHGFLFGQFLSTTINTRSDRWGGSLAGRALLLRQTVRAVRGSAPRELLVGVRLSPEDHGNATGLDLDESLQVARWLGEDGVDFVHLSLWDASLNTQKRPDQHPLPLFRKALPRDVVLVAAGGIWTSDQAEAALERGADAVAIGRAAIANPDWAAKATTPGWQPRRPPLTVPELRERGLSERFAAYMRNWPGFVAP